MADSMSKNFIDYEQYPQTANIQNRCINMIADLFHAPTADGAGVQDAIGTSTVGSSEGIMLAMLAMKKRWQNRRRAEGKDSTHPNIVMNSAVQVCWEKAARYFDVEEKYVYCTETRYVIDPEEAVDLVDENTIGICAILGTTYTGQYEDVKAINDLLIHKKIDCPIHVDAASGGFVAPFVNPDLKWDFQLPKVVSINVSGHKYGLVGTTPESPDVPNRPRSIPASAGYSGAQPSTSLKNSSSTSTTSAPSKQRLRSTSPRAPPTSSASTTSSSGSADTATAPSCRTSPAPQTISPRSCRNSTSPS